MFTLLEKSPCALLWPASEPVFSLPRGAASPFFVASTIITRILTIVIIHIYWAFSVLLDTHAKFWGGSHWVMISGVQKRRLRCRKVTEQGAELRLYWSTGTSSLCPQSLCHPWCASLPKSQLRGLSEALFPSSAHFSLLCPCGPSWLFCTAAAQHLPFCVSSP